MSPQSQGLFQQIIAQSGSNFSPSLHSITASEAARFGIEASIAMGCVLGDGEDRRLECLQGKDDETKLAHLHPDTDLHCRAGPGKVCPAELCARSQSEA